MSYSDQANGSGSRKRVGVVVFFVLFVLVLIGLHVFVSIDDLRGCSTAPDSGNCAAADAIVVVSGGDTDARTDKAVELYKNGWAPLMIVSGAALDTSGPSNAEAMRAYAIDAGIPASAILIDESARDTNENASGAADLARVRGVSNIIVVTSPYHMARAKIIFAREFAGLGVVRGHPSEYDNNWPGNWWATPRGWWLVGGELVKTAVELGRGTVRSDDTL